MDVGIGPAEIAFQSGGQAFQIGGTAAEVGASDFLEADDIGVDAGENGGSGVMIDAAGCPESELHVEGGHSDLGCRARHPSEKAEEEEGDAQGRAGHEEVGKEALGEGEGMGFAEYRPSGQEVHRGKHAG